MKNVNKLVITIISIVFISSMAAYKVNADSNPIQHIVIIMQENRSFDSYFGTYPKATGIPSGTCVPLNVTNPSQGCLKPYEIKNYSTLDMPHNSFASIADIDKGKMDGFISTANQNQAVAYYTAKTIHHYWTFAHNYVLADNFFASSLGYSAPNHWYMISGTTPEIAQNHFIDAAAPTAFKTTYLKEADNIMTLADLLNHTTVSWKYYDDNITANSYKAAVTSGKVYSYWNPFDAQNRSYTKPNYIHFVDRQTIFADIKNNNLPQVSYVIPSGYLSEHAPASVVVGQIWVTQVVDAIMNSPYWNNTVIIVTWDDFGGHYDHAVPPSVDNKGYSIRIPSLIISPYAKAGTIDHTLYSFESTLKLIEWRFNLQPLTLRDANANNIVNALNLTQLPHKPMPITLTSHELAILKSITLSRYLGHIGDKVKIAANGFSQNDSSIILSFGSTILGHYSANSTGSLATTFTVPSTAVNGTNTIKVASLATTEVNQVYMIISGSPNKATIQAVPQGTSPVANGLQDWQKDD